MSEQAAAGSEPSGKASPFRFTMRRLLPFTSLRGRYQQLVNIGLLTTGLALGQGTIFLIQTMLVASGEYELLAAFGTHYSFAILAIIVVDAGATTTLARAVARLATERRPNAEIWQAFCDTSAVRVSAALLISLLAAIYVTEFSSDGFSRWYVTLAIPGLLLSAVNGAGLLDGLKLSGISGITGSAAYIITSIGLALAMHRPHEEAGAILGAAFSLGYLLAVAAQWIVLGRQGWHPVFRRVTRAGLTRAFRDGVALLFQVVPGQINMRVQLLLSTTYLGAETTALFLYAKQVVTASTQVVGFVLRVEFPGLVELLSRTGKPGLADVFRTQRMALICALIFTAGAILLSGLAAELPDFRLHRAATMIAGFAPTILTMSLLLLMMQALAALGAYATLAQALAIGSALGIVASYALVQPFGAYAFVAGEVVLNLAGLYIGYRYLRR